MDVTSRPSLLMVSAGETGAGGGTVVVQCTLAHCTVRNLCLRYLTGRDDLRARATLADGQSHPLGRFPLPEDYT